MFAHMRKKNERESNMNNIELNRGEYAWINCMHSKTTYKYFYSDQIEQKEVFTF